MVFTQAMRDKALDVRRKNKLEKMKARAPKAPKEKSNGELKPPPSTLLGIPLYVSVDAPEDRIILHPTVRGKIEAIPDRVFDWLNSPLPEAQEHLSDLKREYDRAAQIILQRTSRLPQVWKCWSQLNKSLVPKSVLAQCRVNVPDGKWCARDDGHKNAEGQLDPIVLCSPLCNEVYLKNKPIGGLGRR